jgi:1,4-alpha-glucan branching enzyme
MSNTRKPDRSGAPALVRRDPYLAPFAGALAARARRAAETEQRLTGGRLSLADFASGHLHFGLHRIPDGWVFREWAPAASALYLVGEATGWQEDPAFRLARTSDGGEWELRLPADALAHGQLYRLSLHGPAGRCDRIPAWARRVVQDARTLIFNAQVWHPPETYIWRAPRPRRLPEAPFIYEAHVGMAQEAPRVGTFSEFRERVLPRIVDAGYNTLQLMAVQEHPYYGSFGYHVTSFFAVSSRFGTPEEFRELVDAAHEAGLAVIMDLIHSHAARNEVEGLSRFDGTPYQYFHAGGRGVHELWDSRCFDYHKPEVLHFLLSNCRYWLDDYNLDGFRFDGVTSMLYHHHGMGKAFTCYDDYFGGDVDEDAVTYLALANRVIHDVRPDAITVAEDVSGMPGLAAPPEEGGLGFDFRLAMGVPDNWIKLIKHVRDEDWHVAGLWHELTNRRPEEKTISYAESHDQALVGDQTLIFRLIERDMYDHMRTDLRNLAVDRGLALHKMIRLVTLATAGHGYLNFMGNEFGHPEWIDFPREGNGWSYHYARRQWSLRDDPTLVYHFLADFDRAMIELARATRLLEDPTLVLLADHVADGVLAFERRNLVFAFNFHPTRSYTDYGLPAAPGTYRLILDTDAAYTGGFDRLVPNQEAVALWNAAARTHLLKAYLPCRTAAVFLRLPATRTGTSGCTRARGNRRAT